MRLIKIERVRDLLKLIGIVDIDIKYSNTINELSAYYKDIDCIIHFQFTEMIAPDDWQNIYISELIIDNEKHFKKSAKNDIDLFDTIVNSVSLMEKTIKWKKTNTK